MSALVTAIAFVLIFSVVILAHELGHFVAAKLSGVKVEEFGLGYPPRIWGFKRGETIYSINAIPFGGFNKLSGEVDPGAERSLASKSIARRFFVLGAGIMVNVLLAFLLLPIANMVPHDVVVGQVTVEDVTQGSPAQVNGIVPGDIILQLNGHTINNTADLGRYINMNLGRETRLLLQKADGQTQEVILVPRWKPPEGEGAIGVVIKLNNYTITHTGEPFWRAIPLGIRQTFETLVLYKNSFLELIAGTSSMQFVGPVGIAQLTGEVAQAGISPLIEFASFLSLSLAITNLFPIPALDGGRLAFVLLEWVRRGKRISPRVEGLVHTVGAILLIGLMIAITYQDIVRIASGGSLGP